MENLNGMAEIDALQCAQSFPKTYRYVWNMIYCKHKTYRNSQTYHSENDFLKCCGKFVWAMKAVFFQSIRNIIQPLLSREDNIQVCASWNTAMWERQTCQVERMLQTQQLEKQKQAVKPLVLLCTHPMMSLNCLYGLADAIRKLALSLRKRELLREALWAHVG